jgi:hypothetical protein
LFFDLLIISFVISIIGGQQSVFFNLFWATVISATIFFGISGTIGLSIGVLILYPLASYIAHRIFLVNFSLAKSG